MLYLKGGKEYIYEGPIDATEIDEFIKAIANDSSKRENSLVELPNDD